MRYPALDQLMGAYLHQDYSVFGSVEDNVDLFVVETPALAPRLPDEVADLLDSVATDEQIRDILRSLGCQLRPTEGTYRAWLQQIADRVRAATA